MGDDVLITSGRGGWLYVWLPQQTFGIYVRCADLDGRLRIVDFRIDSEGRPITADLLRAIPLGRIEALLNHPDSLQKIRPALVEHSDWVNKKVHEFWPEMVAKATEPIRSSIYAFNRRLKLSIPKTRRFPDEFYSRVAAAFQYASSRIGGPANAIADANDVPVSTVHRWVKEARRRGLLAPAGRKEQQ